MKNFFAEFKKFITRGNVVDMAVGVIVGSSFTAIVNAMSNNILKPIINWLLALIFKADSLSELYSFLKRVYKDVLDEAGDVIGQELDLAQSIYIDWGAFINAVLNFFLIAFVLFTIVKVVNKFRENQKELSEKIAEKTLNRKERRELRSAGVKIYDRAAVEAYFAEKKRIADEAAAEEAARAAKEAEEKAKADREANPTTEDLLKQILETLKNK
jgi:large conductance mechanosensitive channel